MRAAATASGLLFVRIAAHRCTPCWQQGLLTSARTPHLRSLWPYLWPTFLVSRQTSFNGGSCVDSNNAFDCFGSWPTKWKVRVCACSPGSLLWPHLPATVAAAPRTVPCRAHATQGVLM